jgi:hypothetical protein
MPHVAIDNRGDAVAVWIRHELGKSHYSPFVQAAYRLTGHAWQAPADLSAVVSSHGANEPQVAISNKGEPIVVWEESNGDGTSEIECATRGRGFLVWRAPVTLSVPGQVSAPQLSVDAEGEAMAVWSQYQPSGGETVESALRASASSGWTAPLGLSEAGQTSDDARVALSAPGQAIAAWLRTSGGPYMVQEAVATVPGSG